MATDAEILITKAAQSAALAGKSNVGHKHVIADVDGMEPWTFYSSPTNFDSLIVPDGGWASGASALGVRAGVTVSLSLLAIGNTSGVSGANRVMTLPSGWRPLVDYYGRTWAGKAARVLTNGRVELYSPTPSADYFSATFVCSPISIPS